MIQTKHSNIRKAQRGIKDNHISLLVEYGSVLWAPGGLKKITMTRKDIQEAISKRKKEIQTLSNLSGLTAVIDEETILTVYKIH